MDRFLKGGKAIFIFLLAFFLFSCSKQKLTIEVVHPFQVIAVSPSGQDNVPLDTAIKITFSDGVVQSTINSQAIVVTDKAGNQINGTYSYQATSYTVTFMPEKPLKYSTTYIVKVTQGLRRAKDGSNLAKEVDFSFYTVDPPPLQLIYSTPEPGSDNNSRTPTIKLYFSETVNPDSLSGIVVKNVDPESPFYGKNISFNLSYSPSSTVVTLSLTPFSGHVKEQGYLDYSTMYEIEIIGGPKGVKSQRATDVSGWLEPDAINIPFKIVDPPPLFLAFSSPSDQSDNIALSSVVKLYFSEAISPSSFAGNIGLIDTTTGTPIAFNYQYSPGSTVVTIYPSSLTYSTTYSILISGGPSGIKSTRATWEQGWLIPNNVTITFKTLDPPPLTLVAALPSKGAVDIDPSTTIQLIFSNELSPDSVTSDNIYLTYDTDTTTKIPATLTLSGGTKVTLKPVEKLSYNTLYHVWIKGGVNGVRASDATIEGGFLSQDVDYTFTTAKYPPLTVEKIIPHPGKVGFDINGKIYITFSSPIYGKTLTSDSSYSSDGYEPNFFIVKGDVTGYSNPETLASQAVTSTIKYPLSATYPRTAVLIPSQQLEYDTVYTVVISRNVLDIHNQSLTETFTSGFRTRTSSLIEYVLPPNGELGVPVSQVIEVKFTTMMKKSSIDNTDAYLTYTDDNGFVRTVPVKIKYDDTTDLLPDSGDTYDGLGDGTANTIDRIFIYPQPQSTPCRRGVLPLRYGQLYKIHLTARIESNSGEHLNEYVSSFTTRNDPLISSVGMQNYKVTRNLLAGQNKDVPVTSYLIVKFGEPINVTTVTTDSLYIEDSYGSKVTGSIEELNSKSFKLVPLSYLDFDKDYIAVVIGGESGIRTYQNNPLARTYRYKFHTSKKTTYIVEYAKEQTTNFIIVFSRAMDITTINDDTLKIYDDTAGKWKVGLIAYDDRTRSATFIPVPEFTNGDQHTYYIYSDIRDEVGNPVIYSSGTFTPTGNANNGVGTVSVVSEYGSTSNSGNGQTIHGDEWFDLTYDQDMLVASLQDNILYLKDSSSNHLPIRIDYDPVNPADDQGIVRVTPLENMVHGQDYTLISTSDAADASRNGGIDVSFTFTVESNPPNVQNVTTPLTQTGGTTVTSPVVVDFDENIYPASVTNQVDFCVSSVQGLDTAPGLLNSINCLSGKVKVIDSYSVHQIIFVPDSPYIGGTTYYVYLSKYVKDMALNNYDPGNSSGVKEIYNFTTESDAPVVVSTSPANGSTGVTTSTTVVVNFSEPIAVNTIYPDTSGGSGSFQVTYSACGKTFSVEGCIVPMGGEWTTNSFSFIPAEPFAGGVTYSVTLDGSVITDLGGTPMGADYTFSFSATDSVPEVLCSTPSDGETINYSSSVTVYTNIGVDPTSVDNTTFYLYDADSGGNISCGSYAFDNGNKKITCDGLSLQSGNSYYLVFTQGVKDTSGHSLMKDYVIEFSEQ